MTLDLSSYNAIQTNLFVKLDIPDYQVLTFSDYYKSQTISGTTYQPLGDLLSVTDTASSLRANSEELTITISGIVSNRVSEILGLKIKGSAIEVYRGFFNPTTGALLNIVGNPAGKFKGVITNFSINDDLAEGSDTGTVTIVLTATSVVDLLNNKVTGRRTNPIDQKSFYPTDLSMDRVLGLAKSNFNFGAPT